ncbi:Vga family ABC-F type ribosomal protection protein [Domibacillus tundrae]|uniref:Vga family ABC-F type ribosomal protection protein n=1 Tax=Domibacillus tundrae TaxID=1587527 RepID=UPI000617B45D|nr:ABC-F type ribosomal protection protein [Domibacillus tundrae]
MNVLEANTIYLEVQDRLLLSIDHLVIQEKDRIGLVGKNGSGKTTLLHVLAGKTEPDNGTISRNGTIQLLPQLKQIDPNKSGGEITQCYVNEALSKSPKLLLADEPTTHLDTGHVEWLEKKLSKWQGAYVVVSHDRTFLDAVCTVIWEIGNGEIHIYKGNYSAYAAQKEADRQRQELEHEQYEQTKKQLEQAIAAKQKKAERAVKKPKSVSLSEARNVKLYFAKKQKKLQTTAKALETRLEKLEKVEKQKKLPPIRMNVQEQESLKGRVLIRVEQVKGMIGTQLLWKPADFFIRGGDKAALIGPNGSGKTTLLKKIIHNDTGISVAPSVNIGYFSQHITILNADRTILENVKETSHQDETLIRTVLARLGFWREDVFKRVNVLSGGERVKTALAKLLVSEMNVLVLDEPTNFLDIEAVEALESLLIDYEGTVLFTSHDRRFAEKIATKVLVIHETKLNVFDGTLKKYTERQRKSGRDETEEQLLLIETKIAEVLGKMSIEPSDGLEKEFQRLLAEKRMLK